MENVTETNDHKKRQRRKKKERKQENIEEIISKFYDDIDINDSLSTVFKPVPISEEKSGEFWSRVTNVCSPHQARLSSDIVASHLLGVEQARQNKLQKKLDKQVQLGIISSEMRTAQLEKLGRRNLKENDEDDDTFSLLGGDRAKRKRQQVENIVTVLTEHGLDSKSLVVDFGSGSGNLCLALASVFTLTTFVFVDMNQTSLDILSQRSRVAGLTNVKVIKFRFTEENLEEFLELIHAEVGAGMDLGIGLHCCGSFTDLVLELCRLASSDCLIVPCCNGKIDLDQGGYPRSSSMASILSAEDYSLLSRAADDLSGSGSVSEYGMSEDDLSNYRAKLCVELDRATWAREAGAEVACYKMEPVTASPKHLMVYCHFMRN